MLCLHIRKSDNSEALVWHLASFPKFCKRKYDHVIDTKHIA